MWQEPIYKITDLKLQKKKEKLFTTQNRKTDNTCPRPVSEQCLKMPGALFLESTHLALCLQPCAMLDLSPLEGEEKNKEEWPPG